MDTPLPPAPSQLIGRLALPAYFPASSTVGSRPQGGPPISREALRHVNRMYAQCVCYRVEWLSHTGSVMEVVVVIL